MAKNLNSFRIALLTASSATVLLLGMSGSALAVGGPDINANVVNLATANTVAHDSFNGAVTEQSATVNGKTLTITFSGDLQLTMVNINEFTVQDGGNRDFVNNGTINGNTLTLTLGTAVSSHDSITVSYQPSGFYNLKDTNGNEIAAFSSLAVTNTTPSSSSSSSGTNPSTPPAAPSSIRITSLSLHGSKLTITFSEDLQSNKIGPTVFSVREGYTLYAVTKAVINGNKLTLYLKNGVFSPNNDVNISYNPSATDYLMDASGNKVAAFAENLVPPPLTVPAKFEVSGNTMTILFTSSLKGNHAVNPNVFTVMVGNAPDAVTSDKVNGILLTLTLKRPVSVGDDVTIGYHPTSSNHLTSYWGDAIPAFSNQAVTNVTKSNTVTSSTNSSKVLYNGTWLLVGKSPYLTGNGKRDEDYSSQVSALTTEGGVLYAGTRDGVYSFSASVWRLIGSSRYLSTGSLIPFHSTLFATFANKGVAYYANGKWYQAGASQDMNAGALVVLGNKLYTGTDRGIYVLQHDGAWSSVGPSAKLTWAGMLANINGQLYTAASQNDVGKVFAYHNGSWQTVGQLGSYFSPIDVHALIRYHNVLYAATDTGVYAHASGSWNLATRGTWKDVGLDHWDVRTLIILNGTMFAATIHGVYAYVNGSWQQVGASFYQKIGYGAAADVSTLTALHGVLYAGTAYGVYAYRNGAKH